MNREDQEIADLIATLHKPEPDDRHVGVSIDRAMKTGRRKVYARRSAGVLTAVAAVTAVSVASTVIGNQFTSEPQPAATPSGPVYRVGPNPSSTTSRPAWRDPAKSFTLRPFNPWKREFDIGSAGGFTPDGYETRENRQTITLRPENPDGPVRGATATITLYPVGRPYDVLLPIPAPPEPRPAPQLPGGKVYLHHVTSSETLMMWHWTVGAWGFVRLNGMPEESDDASLNRAIHVAESVRDVPGQQIAAPFTIDQQSFPADPDLEIRGAVFSYSRASGTRLWTLRLAAPRSSEQQEFWYSVGVEPSGPRGEPNTTLNGMPAIQTGTEVVIPNIGFGYDAVAKVKNQTPDTTEELRNMVAALRLVANPLAPSGMATNPIQ